MRVLIALCLLFISSFASVYEPVLRCGSGGCTGGAAPQAPMVPVMMYNNNDHMNDYEHPMNDFEAPEHEEYDHEESGSPCGAGGCGGSMGMSSGMGMGMSSGMGMQMNSGMGMMGYESDMETENEDMVYSVTPVVTGYTYKMVPRTYKYTYQKWIPSTATTFTEVPYVNPCANGCQSHNPKCCHKEVTYQTKTVPKVIEETVQVPVEVDVPNSPCGCHVSRPHCCGGSSSAVASAPSSNSGGCSCGATTPHCCSLSRPRYTYGQYVPANFYYGAVGYPFQGY